MCESCGTGTLRCWGGSSFERVTFRAKWKWWLLCDDSAATICSALPMWMSTTSRKRYCSLSLSLSLSLVGLLFDFWSSYPKNFQPMLILRRECPLSGLVSSVTNLNLLWTLGSCSGVNTLDAHFWNVLGFSKIKKRVGYHFLQHNLELVFQNN
jgi:hypothetical protein